MRRSVVVAVAPIASFISGAASAHSNHVASDRKNTAEINASVRTSAQRIRYSNVRFRLCGRGRTSQSPEPMTPRSRQCNPTLATTSRWLVDSLWNSEVDGVRRGRLVIMELIGSARTTKTASFAFVTPSVGATAELPGPVELRNRAHLSGVRRTKVATQRRTRVGCYCNLPRVAEMPGLGEVTHWLPAPPASVTVFLLSAREGVRPGPSARPSVAPFTPIARNGSRVSPIEHDAERTSLVELMTAVTITSQRNPTFQVAASGGQAEALVAPVDDEEA